MTSGRRESVLRHIRNPRFYKGSGRVIPFIEYVAGLQEGIYRPIHHLYRRRAKVSDESFSGSPSFDSLTDEIYNRVKQKRVEQIVDMIVNPRPLNPQRSSPARQAFVSNMRRPLYVREDVFGIGGYICPSCLTIKPVIFRYSDDTSPSNRSSRIYPIQACIGYSSGMSPEEQRRYLIYNNTRGIAPVLMRWITEMWSENHEMKLITFALPEPKISAQRDSPKQPRLNGGGPLAVSRVRVTNKDRDKSLVRKTIVLRKEELNVEDIEPRFSTNLDSSAPFSSIDSSPILFAINESEYVITSENELYSFLCYTKFQTFGLFRVKVSVSSSTSNFATRIYHYRDYLVILVPREYASDMKYTCEAVNHEIRTETP
jgi:hypothetical protein